MNLQPFLRCSCVVCNVTSLVLINQSIVQHIPTASFNSNLLPSYVFSTRRNPEIMNKVKSRTLIHVALEVQFQISACPSSPFLLPSLKIHVNLPCRIVMFFNVINISMNFKRGTLSLSTRNPVYKFHSLNIYRNFFFMGHLMQLLFEI